LAGSCRIFDEFESLAKHAPLDISPLSRIITGILTGQVANPERLGLNGKPSPRLDLDIVIDDSNPPATRPGHDDPADGHSHGGNWAAACSLG
jgi:hypothetical protein